MVHLPELGEKDPILPLNKRYPEILRGAGGRLVPVSKQRSLP